jgi:hypothetical protein
LALLKAQWRFILGLRLAFYPDMQARSPTSRDYPQTFTGNRASPLVSNLPPSLLRVEVFREAASMLMLLSVAILAQHKRRERFAIFLWIFALWDLGYYVALWATVRWPDSPTSADVLFFIPVPWTSQVWFPLLTSILTVAVILLTRPRGRTN